MSKDLYPFEKKNMSTQLGRLVSSFTIVMGITLAAVVAILVMQIINLSWTDQLNGKVNGFLLPAQNITSTCTDIDENRRRISYTNPVSVSYDNYIQPVPCHPNNGDEIVYASTRVASYTKGLPHDSLGHVNQNAYSALLRAVQTKLPQDYDAIPLAPGAVRKLDNPQAGNTYTPLALDSRQYVIPIAPTFASALQAAEMVELYWMALCRDVSFSDYGNSTCIAQAVAELNNLTDYNGIKPVTPENIFRQAVPGTTVGPYISQFMYQPITFGASWISQQMYPPTAGLNFMTNFSEWLSIQNGAAPTGVATFGPAPVYIRNGRDIAGWVHMDVLYQAYFDAALILMEKNVPFKTNIPYVTTSLNQRGFGSWGYPWLFSVLAKLAEPALETVWFQKWNVHRRMRPEEFGGAIHNQKTSAYSYFPPPNNEVLNSLALNLTFNQTGSYLLPQAFPEGSPLHPSYGAGHATVAGACVTFLKCIFQEDFVLNASTFGPILEPDSSGLLLQNYTGNATLTVGGELNKLAGNVALGRNLAGVHWRSDADQSLLLGEDIAISILKGMKPNYPEPFTGFTFTSFTGEIINF